MDTPYLYLLLMGTSFIFPLVRSFESKVAYYKSFGALFTGIAIVGLVFVFWDIAFTHYGIWGFNERYLSSIYIYNLPLGELLFFIVIPYCCVFIYEVLKYFVPRDVLGPHKNSITSFLMAFCASLAVIFYDRWYTVITFGLLTVLLYLHGRVWHTAWLGRFYLAYLVVLIPFFIINGILTGTGLEEEIVWYNNSENMGIRLLTIPLEDIFYGMLLILGVTTIFERVKT